MVVVAIYMSNSFLKNMNNFPFNNFNLLQDLALIKANLLAQSTLQQNNILNPQTQNNVFNSQTPTLFQNQTQTPQNQMEQTFLNHNLETILNEPNLLEKTRLENQEVLKYLKNAMKMPETIEKLVKEISKEQVSESSIEKFLNSLLDVKVLNEFLNKSSKQAIDKMLQTITNSIKTGGSDIAQLKEMLSVLTTIHHNTITDTNTLKELLLLYIPLNCPVFDDRMEFKQITQNQDEKIKSATLSILFETINFSNILCCITSENNDILVELFSINDFPYKDFERIIQVIAKEASLNMRFDFVRINIAPTEKTKQNFRIISNAFIPSSALIVAHLLIKTIFKFDDKFSQS